MPTATRGAPGHQAPEHHAAGQWPAPDDGFRYRAGFPGRKSAGRRQGHGQCSLYQPGTGQGDETDRKSDIYSVGRHDVRDALGQLPFDADDVVAVAMKQITDEPRSLQELVPTVPHGLVEITERAMAKLPANRYSSAAEMLEALNAYVENPAIVFNYTYLPEEVPEKVVTPSMSQKREAALSAAVPKIPAKKARSGARPFSRCCLASRWPLRWPAPLCAGASSTIPAI